MAAIRRGPLEKQDFPGNWEKLISANNRRITGQGHGARAATTAPPAAAPSACGGLRAAAMNFRFHFSNSLAKNSQSVIASHRRRSSIGAR